MNKFSPNQELAQQFGKYIDKISLANPFKISIRAKLVLVSLSLLIIPWVGYQYINEMEEYLRERHNQQLLERARIVASILADQPELFDTKASIRSEKDSKHLYVRPLNEPVQVDGRIDDWASYKERTFHFSDVPIPPQTDETTENNSSLSFRFQLGSYKPYLFALFRVTDEQVIFRSRENPRVDNGDHLQIAMLDNEGSFQVYIVSAFKPGRMTAYRLPQKGSPNINVEEEPRIISHIRKTPAGYNIELKMPLVILGTKLAFAITDIDDSKSRSVKSIVRTTGSNRIEDVGTIIVPSPRIENLLNRMQRNASRIWVMDKNAKVIALNGSLKENDKNVYELTTGKVDNSPGLITSIVRSLYRSILKEPPKEFHDDLSTASKLETEEVIQSLKGRPSTRWRQTPDAGVNILTAAYPVKSGKYVVGSVAIEETANSILILQNRAVEILINLSLLALLVTAFTVFAFATRLSFRVKQLRDNAEHAIASDGRVVGEIHSTNATDEIGDLSRSIADMLKRLAEYNRYLETMASKLSHELRTPITVVRSSLENLDSADLDDEHKAYSKRAKEGVERLSNILTRMSEATRLEQTIQHEERVEFDIQNLVEGCLNGYQVANKQKKFIFQVVNNIRKPFSVNGVPDLMAQMLDKLVSNALDFSLPDTPIVIRLVRGETDVVIQVINDGPTLPESMKNNLFDSMVSMREKRGKQPHLGLGLYIVRLIVEYHQGKVAAGNKPDESGVIFSVLLPQAV